MSRTARPAVLLAVAALLLATLLATPALAACHIAGFEASDLSAEEGDTVEVLVFLQGRQPSCEGTVDWATVAHSATDGDDFEAGSGTLEFVSGDDREEVISIQVLTDDEAEGDETFSVELSNPTGSISGTAEPAVITIAGDGDAAAPAEADGDEAPEGAEAEGETDEADGGGSPLLLILGVAVVLVIAAVLVARRGGGAGQN